MVYAPGEKSGKAEEVTLQNASKQIVETAILQAVNQISQEDEEEKKSDCSADRKLEAGKLNIKPGKKK
ncbi:A-kinase anchor protein inhibitor 1 [Bombina bombina]|uniref:A-kinase anchor protein inhibitor 1 n=1 Tax=Bombina bombina TaxID=8345 RepID=UPI00235B2683|nr:A-kinase anchor protein inhibitor 1 [Bombina bombina]